MAEHPNVARVRKGYEDFGKGDLDALAGLIAEEVVWHSPGRNPLSGDYKGRDATFAYFGKIGESSGGTFKAEPHAILADDEHAVGLHRDSGTRGGKTLDMNEALVFHMKDGMVVEAWEFHEDEYAWDEFWN